jgi:hypothetical protein
MPLHGSHPDAKATSTAEWPHKPRPSMHADQRRRTIDGCRGNREAPRFRLCRMALIALVDLAYLAALLASDPGSRTCACCGEGHPQEAEAGRAGCAGGRLRVCTVPMTDTNMTDPNWDQVVWRALSRPSRIRSSPNANSLP